MKSNKFVSIGLLAFSSGTLINHTIIADYFLGEALMGASLGFLLLGLYAKNHDLSRLKAFKKQLIGAK